MTFKAYADQSPTVQTIKSNWKLRRINLGMAIASLLFVGVGAACTSTNEPAVPPITTPGTTTTEVTAKQVVDFLIATDPDLFNQVCDGYSEALSLGYSRDEIDAVGYPAFRDGYGASEPGMPSAWNVYQHLLTRCGV